jgi:hypothetical protein
MRAWRKFLGVSNSYKARYDGGRYDLQEPTDVAKAIQEDQAMVANLLDLAKGEAATLPTLPPLASGNGLQDSSVEADPQQTQVKPRARPRPWIEVAQDGTMGARAWLAQELNNIGRQQVNPLRHPVDQSPLTQTSGRKLKFSRSPQDTVEKLAANEFFTLYKELYPQQAREHEQHLVAQGLAMVANAKDSQEQAKSSRTQSDAAEYERLKEERRVPNPPPRASEAATDPGLQELVRWLMTNTNTGGPAPLQPQPADRVGPQRPPHADGGLRQNQQHVVRQDHEHLLDDQRELLKQQEAQEMAQMDEGEPAPKRRWNGYRPPPDEVKRKRLEKRQIKRAMRMQRSHTGNPHDPYQCPRCCERRRCEAERRRLAQAEGSDCARSRASGASGAGKYA